MSLCQSNPLYTLVSKSSQYHYGGGGGGGGVRPELGNVSKGHVTEQSSIDREYGAFSGESADVLFNQGFGKELMSRNLGLEQTDKTGPRSIGAMEAGWVEQFSRMQVHDRTEFSNDYKRMYAQYEGTSHARQGMTGGLVNGRNVPVGLPFGGGQGVHFRSHQLNNSNRTEMQEIQDSFFEEQFDAIEKEMEQYDEKEVDTDINSGASVKESSTLMDFDYDQQQFQKTAKDIYTTLSDHSSNNLKFGRSKFMGLMRNISDGVVTLKKDETQYRYTELYSPISGEVFGEEYFPVADTTTGDIFGNIDDLSNMSSTEAAQKVYEQSLRQ